MGFYSDIHLIYQHTPRRILKIGIPRQIRKNFGVVLGILVIIMVTHWPLWGWRKVVCRSRGYSKERRNAARLCVYVYKCRCVTTIYLTPFVFDITHGMYLLSLGTKIYLSRLINVVTTPLAPPSPPFCIREVVVILIPVARYVAMRRWAVLGCACVGSSSISDAFPDKYNPLQCPLEFILKSLQFSRGSTEIKSRNEDAVHISGTKPDITIKLWNTLIWVLRPRNVTGHLYRHVE